MNNITYHHGFQLAYSPAYTFVFEGYAKMLREGLTHPCQDFNMKTEIVYALDVDAQKVVCAQLFAGDAMHRYMTYFAYTHPDYRNSGIATKVFETVENIVKHRKGVVLYTNSVDSNSSVQRVFEKTDRNFISNRYAKFYIDPTQL